MALKTVEEGGGQLTFVRLYQGKLNKGDTITNTPHQSQSKHWAGRENSTPINAKTSDRRAGDIVAAVACDLALGRYVLRQFRRLRPRKKAPSRSTNWSIEPLEGEGATRWRFALKGPTRRSDVPRDDNEETGQTPIAGMGQLHLEIYVERISAKSKVKRGDRGVAYRAETPTRETEFNHKHKKQTGGSGLYAHIVGRIKPLPGISPAVWVEFVDEVFGGKAHPAWKFIALVDAGPCVARQ